MKTVKIHKDLRIQYILNSVYDYDHKHIPGNTDSIDELFKDLGEDVSYLFIEPINLFMINHGGFDEFSVWNDFDKFETLDRMVRFFDILYNQIVYNTHKSIIPMELFYVPLVNSGNWSKDMINRFIKYNTKFNSIFSAINFCNNKHIKEIYGYLLDKSFNNKSYMTWQKAVILWNDVIDQIIFNFSSYDNKNSRLYQLTIPYCKFIPYLLYKELPKIKDNYGLVNNNAIDDLLNFGKVGYNFDRLLYLSKKITEIIDNNDLIENKKQYRPSIKRIS
jgi:hypothetical protein